MIAHLSKVVHITKLCNVEEIHYRVSDEFDSFVPEGNNGNG